MTARDGTDRLDTSEANEARKMSIERSRWQREGIPHAGLPAPSSRRGEQGSSIGGIISRSLPITVVVHVAVSVVSEMVESTLDWKVLCEYLNFCHRGTRVDRSIRGETHPAPGVESCILTGLLCGADHPALG